MPLFYFHVPYSSVLLFFGSLTEEPVATGLYMDSKKNMGPSCQYNIVAKVFKPKLILSQIGYWGDLLWV